MGYLKTAAIGFSWVAGFRLSIKLFGFIRTAILAIILMPAQFGLYGIATLILGFLEMVTETGINVVLVQDEADQDFSQKINTAFVISIIRGLILSIAIAASSKIIADFFHKPEAYPIILLISLVPLLRGFINPGIVLLQKNLLFKTEFFIRLGITLADAVTAISLSFLLQSPIALACGMIAGVVTEIVCSYLFIPVTPKFKFNSLHFRHITNRGKWVTMAGILNYLAVRGPEYIIGRLYDAANLGFYNLGNNLSMLAVNEFNEAMNRVNFPLYIRIKATPDRILKAFIKHSVATFLIVTPISLMMIFFAEPIVMLVAGPNWLPTIPMVRLISIYAILINIGSSSYPLFLANNRQHYLTLITLIQLLSFAASVLPLTNLHGSHGVIYALIVSASVILPLKIYLAFNLLLNPRIDPDITPQSVTT